MNISKLAAAGVDYEDGLNRFCGKEELYQKYILRFPQQKEYHQLLAAIGKKDCKEAFEYAHALKGITGNLSFIELRKILTELTEELKSGNLEAAGKYVPMLEKEYQALVEIIEEQ